MRPEEIAVAKRFVVVAVEKLPVVAKRDVVVAFVVVELPVTFRFPAIVKFPTTVDEAFDMKPEERVERPETESVPRVPMEVREERVVTEELM